jgi:predicted metal-dependent RNase
MKENLVIQLDYPIEIKKKDGLIKRIEKIEVRRIKAKDLKYFPKEMLEEGSNKKNVDVVKLLPLVSSICELTLDEVGEIDLVSDLPKIVDAIRESLPGEFTPSV